MKSTAITIIAVLVVAASLIWYVWITNPLTCTKKEKSEKCSHSEMDSLSKKDSLEGLYPPESLYHKRR